MVILASENKETEYTIKKVIKIMPLVLLMKISSLVL